MLFLWQSYQQQVQLEIHHILPEISLPGLYFHFMITGDSDGANVRLNRKLSEAFSSSFMSFSAVVKSKYRLPHCFDFANSFTMCRMRPCNVVCLYLGWYEKPYIIFACSYFLYRTFVIYLRLNGYVWVTSEPTNLDSELSRSTDMVILILITWNGFLN